MCIKVCLHPSLQVCFKQVILYGQCSVLRMDKQRKYSEDFNNNSVAAGWY